MPSKGKKKRSNHFLAVWDNQGLECIYDIGEYLDRHEAWEKQKVIAILKDEEQVAPPKGPPLNMILMRAKFNSQRHYEIYEFTTEMSMEEVKELFDECPQTIVDSIREVGHKIYSDREREDSIRIR